MRANIINHKTINLMKKSLLLTALLCLLTTAFPALADTYSYTFTKAAEFPGNNETKEISNSNQTSTLTTATWGFQATGDKEPYMGWASGKGVQIGSKSAPASSAVVSISGIPGSITSVKINTSGASGIAGTVGVKVGATDFKNGDDATVTLTKDATTYDFTGEASGEIAISYAQTSSLALYILSVEVTFEDAGSSDKETATLAWNNAPESINVGETVNLANYLTVEPQAAADAVYYAVTNETVASVEGSTLTALKRGSTTVRAYITGSDTYKDVPAVTFDLTVVDPNATFKTYTEVTSLDNLDEGWEAILVNSDATFALSSTQSSNNRPATAISKNADGTISVYDDDTAVARILLENAGTTTKGEGDDATTINLYSLKATNGEEDAQGYLYAASSTSNYLRTSAELGETGKAVITFTANETDGEPDGTYATSIVFERDDHNVLQYNSSNNIFACYSNTQGAVKIYAIQTLPRTAVDLSWKLNDEDVTAATATMRETFNAPVLTGLPADVTAVYTSSVPEVATIDATGAITLVKEGVTVIKAEFAGDDTYKPAEAEYTLTVLDPLVVSAPTFDPPAGDVKVGQLVTLATITPDAKISYKIGEGEMTEYTEPFALETAGEITITAVATLEDKTSETVTAVYNVSKYETSLSYSAENAVAYLDKTDRFKAPVLTVTPEEIASDVTYVSTDEAVATVNADGEVTIIAAGTTVITASYAGDNKYEAAEAVSYNLTVEEKAPLAFDVIFSTDGFIYLDTATEMSAFIKEGAEYFSGIKEAVNAYGGDTDGFRIGKSNEAGSCVMTLAEPVIITKIEATCRLYSEADAETAFTINGVTETIPAGDATLKSYTFTYPQPEAVETLSFSTDEGAKKRVYVSAMTIHFADKDGVCQVITATPGERVVYDLNGCVVNASGELQPGLYIIREGNEVRKVLVK